jgi:hypothetical protein
MSGQFEMIQQFKKEAEEIASLENMSGYTGKAFGEKYAEEWIRIFSEHFSVEEIYSEEDLATFFQEKLEEGGEFSSIAYDHITAGIEDESVSLHDLLDLDSNDGKARLIALVQSNFYVEEVFPRERDIDGTINEERWSKPHEYKEGDDLKIGETITEIMEHLRSPSISGEVSRQVETLEAQNSQLVAENQRLKLQLQQLKAILSQ